MDKSGEQGNVGRAGLSIITYFFIASSILIFSTNAFAADKILSVTPDELVFVASESGVNPATQSIYISNSGPGQLTWGITEDCAWLSVSPSSGECSNMLPSEVIVSVDISGLGEGLYTYELQVTAPEAVNSPQSVSVNLHIRSGLYVPTPEYPTIQSAIDSAIDDDTVIVSKGIYVENINFGGKNIVVTSVNPDSPNVVDIRPNDRCSGHLSFRPLVLSPTSSPLACGAGLLFQ